MMNLFKVTNKVEGASVLISHGKFEQIERRRLIAKILMLTARDHSLTKLMGKDFTYQVYEITIQNLTDFYPVFQEFAQKLDRKTFEDGDFSE